MKYHVINHHHISQDNLADLFVIDCVEPLDYEKLLSMVNLGWYIALYMRIHFCSCNYTDYGVLCCIIV